MKIATKYDIGEILFAVDLIRKDASKTCPTCDGGTLVVYDERDRNVTHAAVEIGGRLFPCPDCGGSGEKTRSVAAFGLQSGRVSKVRVSVEERGGTSVLYTLGVFASGSYRNEFREDECYRDREEAQARADASNAYKEERT